MRGRSTLLFILAAFLTLGLTMPAAAASPELVCGEIPFGKPLDDVLQIYEGSNIARQETPYIESIGNYALEKYFKGGLTKDDSGICFLPKIVQKYNVTNEGWKDCASMTLYFGAFEKGATDYSLFMAKRTLPKPAAQSDFKQIFEDLSGKMDKATGSGHTTDQGRIQSFDERSHNFYLPALVGTWEAKDTLVFVMVANSPDGPLSPEEIFVSKPSLKRYLEVCKNY